MEAEIVAKISRLHFSASLFLTLIKKLGAKTIAGKQFFPQILTLEAESEVDLYHQHIDLLFTP